MKGLLLALLIVLCLSACTPGDSASGPAPDFSPIPPGDGVPGALAPGMSIAYEGYELRFEGVLEDSRCPLDVACVWAGEARALVTVSAPDGGQQEVILSTQPDGASADLGDATVTLESLWPEPYSTQTIAPTDYRVLLRMSQG